MKHRARSERRSNWPRLFGAAGFLLLVGLLGLFLVMRSSDTPAAGGDPTATGRLEASETTVDLGRVPFDRQAEGRFELVNTGGSTVRLVGKPEVKTLEGC